MINMDDFWSLVDKIGWGTKTTDYDMVKLRLLKTFSDEQLRELQKIKSRLHNQLAAAVVHAEEDSQIGCLELGEDSFGDLINHIIGLGKAEFERALKTPSAVEERALNSDYKESFSYCFPHEREREQMTNPQPLAERLGQAVARLSETKQELKQELGQLETDIPEVWLAEQMLRNNQVADVVALEQKLSGIGERHRSSLRWLLENIVNDLKLQVTWQTVEPY